MSIRTAMSIPLVATLGITAALVAAPAASADSTTSTFAQAQFLSGSLLGTDLDGIVALDAATAANDGSVASAQERNPLSITALDAITVAPGAIRVTGIDGVEAGVVGQVAVAEDDGTSWAATGAIGADGAVAVGDGAGVSASVDLAQLLGADIGSQIAQLRLDAVGIAAKAEAALGEVSGESTVADVRLVLQVPAIAGLGDRTAGAIAPIQASLDSLAGPAGPLAGALDRALLNSGSVGILGTGASVTVSVDANLTGIADGLRSGLLHDPALTIDLATGEISVDLDALPASQGLNGLAPGSEVLSEAVVSDIVAGAHRLLDNALQGVEDTLRAAVRDARVHLSAELSVLDTVQTGETIREIPHTVTYVVDRLTGATLGILDPSTGVITSLVAGVDGGQLRQLLDGVGGLLAIVLGLTNGVTTTVVTTIEQIVEPVFATLETGVSVSVDGTLAQVGSSSASVSASAVVLGVPVALDVSVLLGELGSVLGTDGGLGGAIDALLPAVLDPLAGPIDGDGDSIASILGGLLSVRAHVDSTSTTAAGPAYTRTALQVSVLGGSLATVDLAAATVGPNTAGPGGPDPENPDPGPGGPDPRGGWSGLAFTGDGLPWLALLLALAVIAVGTTMAVRRARAAAAAGAGAVDAIEP